MSSLTHLAAPEHVFVAQGILEQINQLSSDGADTVRNVAIVVAIAVFLWFAAASRFAMGKVIVSGLAAGVVLYFIFNITDVRDLFDQEMSMPAGPAVVETVPVAGPSI